MTGITKSDIAEFRKLYKERFGKIIDDQTARKKLSMLVRQMEVVYQPITQEQASGITWFERLLSEDDQYGFPPYVVEKEAALRTLYTFIPPQTLVGYCDRFSSSDEQYKGLIRFVRPMELLIAGNYILELTKWQKPELLNKVKAKFQNLKLVDSQLSDLLAELEVMIFIGQHYEIDIDVNTGVITKNGEKNSDIYIVDSDIFIEVKNYEMGKSSDEKKMDELWAEYFSDQNSTPKQLQIVRSKRAPKVEVIGEQPNMKSIGIIGLNPKKRYQQMIRNAESKFKSEQKAVLVLTGLFRPEIAAQAVNDWYTPKKELSPIKAVVMLEGRQAYTYKVTQHLIELEDSNLVKDFITNMKFNN